MIRKVSRRGFLKIGGLAALGLLAKPVFDLLSKHESAETLPQAKVLAAKRWAMVINLNICKVKDGCVECIKACHTIHNVPVFDNPKDEIKWLWTVPYEKAFKEHSKFLRKDLKGFPTLVLCNHCDNPPCVQVCPVKATWKREDGIIMQDYHRCIGCRYCMAACPYGARSFNWRDPRPFIPEINPEYPTRMRGVVEKCNFCEERLAQGLLPACVEACQACCGEREKALVFGDLEDADSEVRRTLATSYSQRRKTYLGTNPQVYYIV